MTKPLSTHEIFEKGLILENGLCEKTLPKLQKMLVVNAARFCDENFETMFDEYARLVSEMSAPYDHSYTSLYLFMFHRHGIDTESTSSSLKKYDKVIAVKLRSVRPELGLGPEHIRWLEIRDATDPTMR